MRLSFSSGIIILALAAPAFAQTAPVPGASNMLPDFYPQPKCEKPGTAPKSPGNGDNDAMMSYNVRVRNFNQKAMAFNLCLKAYVDAAQNDINAIQAIVHAAVAEANAH
jgi:hypothetical protein